MSIETGLRRRYLARIANHMGALYSAGVLRLHPGQSAFIPLKQAEGVVLELVRWIRRLNAARVVVEEILPAAFREPGRLFQRQIEIASHSPRGAIHWTRTVAHRMRPGRELQLVCHTGRRVLLAPENMLLTHVLECLASESSRGWERLEASGMLGAEGVTRLCTYGEAARRALTAQPFSMCRSTSVLLGGAPQRRGELVRQARHRATGCPPTAPPWAGRLVDLAEDATWAPQRVTNARLDERALWSLLARYEAISVVRRFWPLREQPSAKVLRIGSCTMEPMEKPKGFALRRGSQNLAAIALHDGGSWQTVESSALHDIWFAQHTGSNVDRWLVMHSCSEPAEFRLHERGTLQIGYLRVDVDRAVSLDASATLGKWLHGG